MTKPFAGATARGRIDNGLSFLWPILAMIAVSALGGCAHGVLDPRGPISSAQKIILFDSLGIMLAIVIPTIVATLAVAWWYRASHARARYLSDWEYSGRIEMISWSVPAMTVLLLSGIFG
jgi:cytochrome o ubiquinol oxidase subunit II